MERGPGIFKINRSIPLDNADQTKVKDSIRETEGLNKGCNPNTLRELKKGTIRNETIKYSVFKNKSEREKETKLVNEIKLLEEKLGKCSSNEVYTITKEIIIHKQLELERYNDEKVSGYIVRARAVHIETNENNTSKSRAEKNTICK